MLTIGVGLVCLAAGFAAGALVFRNNKAYLDKVEKSIRS
ncbi:hypothetical protein Dalk_3983 [Desulfatibacillum aliphaticivorans]|uniref:Uncharacterized protein n=1 Tax=Desulfatibacillum aliphaticivorans TaxID=218208 RepID=B8FJK0_DESAL|nr:hypothetical protein Dalk_3983 [Desulfatibacillum aliphaticivorans]